MPNQRLRLKNVGPIGDADVQFGDLTILVGPQGTGKSIFLQIFKLLLDACPILGYVDEHGLNRHGDIREFLELYVGEGTGGLWQPRRSKIVWRESSLDLKAFVSSKRHGGIERGFLIPAQRVTAFTRDGWFRPFNDYKAGDPYSVRDFSEKLRRLMESDVGSNGAIYPQPGRLNPEIWELLSKDIFRGFRLELEKTGPQKRLVLHGDGTVIPYMVWSAGQREFVPLLLGLYRLLPAVRIQRLESIRWVMIEEMEMGLHPRAIAAVFVIVLELLSRGYRVCLSTHSTQILDLVWAFRNLREHNADPKGVLSLFDLKTTPSTLRLAKAALAKIARVYYFDPESRTTRDISTLDPSARELAESGWGGLTELSGRLADMVAESVAGGRAT